MNKIEFKQFLQNTKDNIQEKLNPKKIGTKISYIDKYTIKKNNRSPNRVGFTIKTPLSKGSSKISIQNLL